MRSENDSHHSNPSGGRPAVKQEGVLEHLREQILDGTLRPGARLPTRTELQAIFQVSSVTVQRALDQLVADGFVHARRRHGTFVSQHLPHLHQYALAFPSRPGDAGWVRFWSVLDQEAAGVVASPRRLSVFKGIDGRADCADYQQLMRSVRSRRLAGLIFAFQPDRLAGTPLLEHPGLPRVAVMRAGKVPGLASIDLDHASFVGKALDRLAARGRTRIAVVAAPGHIPAFFTVFSEGLRERGLTTRPYWTQALFPGEGASARSHVHLLMHGDQRERPDGLIITDDNLVEHACAGLIDAGLRVPEDVDVIAHCNFPWRTASALPVARLGFDARRVLRRCLATLDAQRAGQPPAAQPPEQALFEEETHPA